MNANVSLSVILILALSPAAASAQGRPVHWHRHGKPTPLPITVFHSPQSADLPTAATIGKGILQFEVSHRFVPPFSAGPSSLWGLDGPIYNRLGLSYGPTNNSMVSILHSNLQNNVLLRAKVRVLSGGRSSIPYQIAVVGGYAWNTGVSPADGPGYRKNEGQAYGQLVLNALVLPKLAVGVVPTLLYNPRIQDMNAPSELTLGFNATLYLTRHLGVIGEWNVSPAHRNLRHQAVAAGLQIEAGGHFFDMIVTNSDRPNPTQYLGGTPYEFTPSQWRFGFNITRIFRL